MTSQRPSRVAIVWGGESSEREVSGWSAGMVREHLDPGRFPAELVDLSEVGPGRRWDLTTLAQRFDVAFLVCHGGAGEDGTFQGLLELIGMPYTGSGVLASALAMNKIRTKQVLRQVGLPTPDWEAIDLRLTDGAGIEAWKSRLGATLGFPLVLKADHQGSSVGIAIVSDDAALQAAWPEIAALGPEILAERFIPGVEVTGGVVGGGHVEALPVVEIIPASGWFDFEAKYRSEGTQEIVPARLDPALTVRVQELAVAAHRALGCWGMSRTDMRIDAAGEVWILETNTLPGMTAQSLLPRAARAAGWTLGDLCDRLIETALERHGEGRLGAGAVTG